MNFQFCRIAAEIKEGNVSDENDLQITLKIKKSSFQSQHEHVYSKNCIILTQKQLFFYWILFHGHKALFFSNGKFPKFLDKMSLLSFNESY